MCPSPGTTALSGRWSCLRRSPRGRGPAAAAGAVPCGAARAPRPWPKSAAEPTATTARRRCEGRTGKTGPQTVSCQALSDCHVDIDIRQLCQWMSMHVNGKRQEMECPQITSFFPAVSSLLFESPHAVNKGQSSAELRSSGQSMRSPCTWPRTRCCPAEAPLRLRCLQRLRLSGRSLWSSHLLTLCFLQVQKRLSDNQNHMSHMSWSKSILSMAQEKHCHWETSLSSHSHIPKRNQFQVQQGSCCSPGRAMPSPTVAKTAAQWFPIASPCLRGLCQRLPSQRTSRRLSCCVEVPLKLT